MAVTTSPTVLVLRALGMGDLLTAVPALRGLREAYPAHRIVLAAPTATADLLPLIGAVDELLPTPVLRRLPWQGPGPDLAVNLHGRGPQSTRLCTLLSPRTLYSHRGPSHSDVDGPDWDPSVHEVYRWCRLLGHYGVPADPGDLTLAPPPVPSPAPGAVVVHPGASHAARRWPTARYAAVARRLAATGARVVVTGSTAERATACRVAAGAGLPEGRVIAGTTGLWELAALVAGAALVVCGDTGMAHLATAYGTPSVVLFGPVPPALWGPPPDRPQHVALWAGRTGDTFADQPDPGLLRIGTGDVTAAALELLSGGVSACPATG